MSIEAIAWTLNAAPDLPPALVATLLGLANHTDPAGRGAMPSQQRLAFYTRKTERTVRRDLEQLEQLGLIRRGDQRRAAYLPPDRRPIVWDLAMDRTRPIPAHLDVHAEPRSGTTAAHPQEHAGYPQAGQAVDNREDADVRPDANVPPLPRSGGRTRPPAHHAATSGNGNREDAHVRRTVLVEEVYTSGNLDLARQLLAALPEPWRIGRKTIEQLAPVVAVALDAGWIADKLRTHLTANPEGVRSPHAVLRARINDLPPPPPVPRREPAAKPPRVVPDWCGQCLPETRLTSSTIYPGRLVRCSVCNPASGFTR